MGEVKIEIADEKDAKGIAQIAYQVAKMHDEKAPEYFKPISEEAQFKNIQEMLREDAVIVFKAIFEDKICGFLFLEIIHRASIGLMFSKLGCILNLGVDEVYRGRGIGTKLIQEAEKYVYEHNGEALDLSVFAFNKDAIKLYEHLGFEVIDVSMRKVIK